MGCSGSEVACKRHPDNQQLQGVCPSCLRERLFHLCASSSYREAVRVTPSFLSATSASSSPELPPSAFASPGRGRPYQRNVSDLMGSISFMVVGNVLKKSRSIAFVPRGFVGESKNGKKKKGFWSKLLHFKGKRDGLMHSRTVRERLG